MEKWNVNVVTSVLTERHFLSCRQLQRRTSQNNSSPWYITEQAAHTFEQDQIKLIAGKQRMGSEWSSWIKVASSPLHVERKNCSECSVRGAEQEAVSIYTDWQERKWRDLGSGLPLVIHVVLFQSVCSLLAHKHRGNNQLLHNIHWKGKTKESVLLCGTLKKLCLTLWPLK